MMIFAPPMRLVLLIALLVQSGACTAQLLDSISLFMQEKPRLLAKLDMRGSFVRNESVRIAGLKLGLEHAGRFQYGIGYSLLFSPVERQERVEGVGEVTTRLRMGYLSPYVDYAFYQRGPWEVRLPVQIGLGRISQGYTDGSGSRQEVRSSLLFLYEPAMTVQYRFWKYLAVGGGWGFRLAFTNSGALGEGLTAPIYTLGLRVFFGDIWADVRGATGEAR
jgi:hypothetical protein